MSWWTNQKELVDLHQFPPAKAARKSGSPWPQGLWHEIAPIHFHISFSSWPVTKDLCPVLECDAEIKQVIFKPSMLIMHAVLEDLAGHWTLKGAGHVALTFNWIGYHPAIQRRWHNADSTSFSKWWINLENCWDLKAIVESTSAFQRWITSGTLTLIQLSISVKFQRSFNVLYKQNVNIFATSIRCINIIRSNSCQIYSATMLMYNN